METTPYSLMKILFTCHMYLAFYDVLSPTIRYIRRSIMIFADLVYITECLYVHQRKCIYTQSDNERDVEKNNEARRLGSYVGEKECVKLCGVIVWCVSFCGVKEKIKQRKKYLRNNG